MKKWFGKKSVRLLCSLVAVVCLLGVGFVAVGTYLNTPDCPVCGHKTKVQYENCYDNEYLFGHCHNDKSQPHYRAYRYQIWHCESCGLSGEDVVEDGYYCAYHCKGYVFY